MSLEKPKGLRGTNVEFGEYSYFDRDFPYHLSISIDFKTQSERNKFKSKIRKILDGEI